MPDEHTHICCICLKPFSCMDPNCSVHDDDLEVEPDPKVCPNCDEKMHSGDYDEWLAQQPDLDYLEPSDQGYASFWSGSTQDMRG